MKKPIVRAEVRAPGLVLFDIKYEGQDPDPGQGGNQTSKKPAEEKTQKHNEARP